MNGRRQQTHSILVLSLDQGQNEQIEKYCNFICVSFSCCNRFETLQWDRPQTPYILVPSGQWGNLAGEKQLCPVWWVGVETADKFCGCKSYRYMIIWAVIFCVWNTYSVTEEVVIYKLSLFTFLMEKIFVVWYCNELLWSLITASSQYLYYFISKS